MLLTQFAGPGVVFLTLASANEVTLENLTRSSSRYYKRALGRGGSGGTGGIEERQGGFRFKNPNEQREYSELVQRVLQFQIQDLKRRLRLDALGEGTGENVRIDRKSLIAKKHDLEDRLLAVPGYMKCQKGYTRQGSRVCFGSSPDESFRNSERPK